MPSVLVTGAARGFGREVAIVYVERGWTVFPLVRREADAEGWAAGCHPIVGDVGREEVEAAIASTLGDHARSLDLLVNNAGDVVKRRWLAETSAEDIEALFRVHCVGAFRCTRAALPFLRRAARPAAVVNVSSRFGSMARVSGGEFRGIYSYSIAKAAQNMLTACLDQELRRDGIRMLAVHPGRLRTAAGAADADTDPREAAAKLADWLETVDPSVPAGLWDLMENRFLPW